MTFFQIASTGYHRFSKHKGGGGGGGGKTNVGRLIIVTASWVAPAVPTPAAAPSYPRTLSIVSPRSFGGGDGQRRRIKNGHIEAANVLKTEQLTAAAASGELRDVQLAGLQ